MRFSAVISEMWTRPSTPGAISTKAPNLVRRETGPSMTAPGWMVLTIFGEGVAEGLFQAETHALSVPGRY